MRIQGRVQGVFFRASCAREADVLGISGWIRNAPDGSVEAVFEGDPRAVEAISQWCRAGPAGARVDEVVIADEAPEGLNGFDVTS